MSDATQPALVVESNLRHAMRFYGSANIEGCVREMPGVMAVSCGRNYPIFNSALLCSEVPGPDGVLTTRLALPSIHFRAMHLGWSYWICHALLHDLAFREVQRTCEAYGLHHVLTAPGMFAQQLTQPVRLAPRLDVREVSGGAERLEFAYLISQIFDLPFGMTANIYGDHAGWSDDYAAFIGYVNGMPVTIAMLNRDGESCGFYSVGTIAGYRRRGYAEALLREAYQRARIRWNSRFCVLQSSSSGRRLYEKLGFRVVTQFSVFRSAAP